MQKQADAGSGHLSHYVLGGILLLMLWVAYILVKPYLNYIIMSFIIALATYPLYDKLKVKLGGRKNLASFLMVFFIIVIIVLPLLYIVSQLVDQSLGAYQSFDSDRLSRVSASLEDLIGSEIDLAALADSFIARLRILILKAGPDVLVNVADIMMGLFVMFFLLFYAFRDGPLLTATLKKFLPMEKKVIDEVFSEGYMILNGVVYGQVLTAIIQGLVGGLGLFIFGIDNALFWSFILIILSFLPIIGTPIVWIPFSILEVMNGNLVSGIGLFIYSAIITTNIDNVVKPLLISGKTSVHPAIILVGVLGGLKIFGFVGIITGPLLLAILLTMLRVYHHEANQPAQ
ncbi:MAG: AI-2E family transporter [Candidatus Woesearchaeota archaeon]|nr:MAG: AI-2E family transporter [Candidatus Woesearchaeota archaeon]